MLGNFCWCNYMVFLSAARQELDEKRKQLRYWVKHTFFFTKSMLFFPDMLVCFGL